jgi:hypothetical protein
MLPQVCFFVSIAFSFVAWGIVAVRYIWPQLRDRQRNDALRPLLILHSFRFEGLVFLVPGVVSPDLPSAFAHSAAYGDIMAATPRVAFVADTANKSRHRHRMDLQSLGFSRSPARVLRGQCRRVAGGAVGSRLLHPDFRGAAAVDHAWTHLPNSSAASKSIRHAGKPASSLDAGLPVGQISKSVSSPVSKNIPVHF